MSGVTRTYLIYVVMKTHEIACFSSTYSTRMLRLLHVQIFIKRMLPLKFLSTAIVPQWVLMHWKCHNPVTLGAYQLGIMIIRACSNHS